MTDDLRNISCVVLGGGGFMGRALIRALLASGALVRGFGRVARFGEPETTFPWVYGNFEDPLALARAVEGMEVVFHLAAGSTPERSNAAPVSDLIASVAGTVELLEVCRAEGVRRVVFASSGGTVYGIPQELPILETAATDPISAYGVNKLAAEKYLRLYEYLHRVEHLCLRVSNPFGPYQDPLGRQGLVAASLQKILAGAPIEIWGDGLVTRDYVYVDDVAEAFLKAATYTGSHRVFNIGSGIGMSVNDVIDATAAAVGPKTPQKTFKVARKADVPVNILDVTLAASELDWRAHTPWVEAIRRTADWMKTEPSVKSLFRSGSNG